MTIHPPAKTPEMKRSSKETTFVHMKTWHTSNESVALHTYSAARYSENHPIYVIGVSTASKYIIDALITTARPPTGAFNPGTVHQPTMTIQAPPQTPEMKRCSKETVIVSMITRHALDESFTLYARSTAMTWSFTNTPMKTKAIPDDRAKLKPQNGYR
jgi:hypothetical protein